MSWVLAIFRGFNMWVEVEVWAASDRDDPPPRLDSVLHAAEQEDLAQGNGEDFVDLDAGQHVPIAS